ncbi:phytanoyl-CoA dioxygenase family protein [Spirosoma aerophilum]
MPTNLNISDRVITVSDSFQPVKVGILLQYIRSFLTRLVVSSVCNPFMPFMPAIFTPPLSITTRLGDSLFWPQARAVTSLSSQEITQFTRKGWVGAFPLLTPAGVERATDVHYQVEHQFMPEPLMPTLHRKDAFEQRPWVKSKHVYVAEYNAIVRHPAIVNRVASILGPDLIAWGLSVAVRQPGQKHRWHVDIEHHRWPGLTVFIGLRGSSANSSLNVISGSHHTKAIP